MSKAEILAELPRLGPEERRQVFERLCQLQDDDLLRGDGPTETEKQLLDEALAEFARDKDRGTPWREAISRIRSGGKP